MKEKKMKQTRRRWRGSRILWTSWRMER